MEKYLVPRRLARYATPPPVGLAPDARRFARELR